MILNYEKYLEGQFYQDTAKEYGDVYTQLKSKRGVRASKEEGYFEELPSPELAEDLLQEYFKPGFKLLDIGCGLGNILKLARSIGYEATGVEINRKLEKHHAGLDVIYGDVLNLPNYNFLKEFDVIYLYRPIEPLDKCDRLFEILYKYCKPSVVIIYLLPSQLNLNLQRKFEYRLFPIYYTSYDDKREPNFPMGRPVVTDSGRKTKYQYDKNSNEYYSILTPKPGVRDINVGGIIEQIVNILKNYEIKVGKSSFYAGKPSFKFKREDYPDFIIKLENVVKILKKYNLINIQFEYESNEIRGPLKRLGEYATTHDIFTKTKRDANYNNILPSLKKDVQDERVKHITMRLLYNLIDGQYYENWNPYGRGYN